MLNKTLKRSGATGSSSPTAFSAGNALSEKQLTILKDVFQTEAAAGFTEALMDLYQGYLQTSSDEIGSISPEELESKFFIVRQLSKLLRAIEPTDYFLWGKTGDSDEADAKDLTVIKNNLNASINV